MLKFLFSLLLLANGALFAYHQGYLDTLFPDGREPARAARQMNADKVKLIPVSAVERATPPQVPPAAPAPAPQAVAAPVDEKRTLACTEIGTFDAAGAKRFEARIAALSLGDRLVRRPLGDAARNMVYIPPQGSKEAADKKAAELRQLGIKDFYVIQDGEQRWGISLGIFRSEEAARAQLVELAQKGVRSARLGMYSVPSGKVVFRLRDLDAHAQAALDKIKADFPQQETRACQSAQAQ